MARVLGKKVKETNKTKKSRKKSTGNDGTSKDRRHNRNQKLNQ